MCARAVRGASQKGARLVFEAIIFVLRTGCQWKALPAERFGSASAIHARFMQWEKAGFFESLWKAGLAEYDDLQGIAWEWQSIDGAMVKAPLAQESVGANPTDIAHVKGRGQEARELQPEPGKRARRWIVEVAHSWFNRFRKLLVRYEKLHCTYLALNHLAASIIAFKKVTLAVNIIYG